MDGMRSEADGVGLDALKAIALDDPVRGAQAQPAGAVVVEVVVAEDEIGAGDRRQVELHADGERHRLRQRDAHGVDRLARGDLEGLAQRLLEFRVGLGDRASGDGAGLDDTVALRIEEPHGVARPRADGEFRVVGAADPKGARVDRGGHLHDGPVQVHRVVAHVREVAAFQGRTLARVAHIEAVGDAAEQARVGGAGRRRPALDDAVGEGERPGATAQQEAAGRRREHGDVLHRHAVAVAEEEGVGTRILESDEVADTHLRISGQLHGQGEAAARGAEHLEGAGVKVGDLAAPAERGGVKREDAAPPGQVGKQRVAGMHLELHGAVIGRQAGDRGLRERQRIAVDGESPDGHVRAGHNGQHTAVRREEQRDAGPFEGESAGACDRDPAGEAVAAGRDRERVAALGEGAGELGLQVERLGGHGDLLGGRAATGEADKQTHGKQHRAITSRDHGTAPPYDNPATHAPAGALSQGGMGPRRWGEHPTPHRPSFTLSSTRR